MVLRATRATLIKSTASQLPALVISLTYRPLLRPQSQFGHPDPWNGSAGSISAATKFKNEHYIFHSSSKFSFQFVSLMFNKIFLLRNSLAGLLLCLRAATPAAASVLPRSSQTIRWVDCHENVPQPIESALNVTGTSFNGTLPSTLFCGEMDVPMDYTKPFDAATNNITIGFAMNRPVKSSGLIIYTTTFFEFLIYDITGGPGLDAASQAWANALNLSSGAPFAELSTRAEFNFHPPQLFFGCFFNDIPFAFPSSQTEYDQYQAAMKNFYSACTNNSTPAGIMQHVGTIEVIQDWDSVRAALGYEKWNFCGDGVCSAVPQRVDRFVLDAAIPHGMPFQYMVTDQIAAANRLVLRADAFCLTDPTCPFHGKAMAASLRCEGCNSPVTPTDLRLGLTVLFRANPDFPLFNIALNASCTGRHLLQIEDAQKTFAAFNNLSLNAQSSDPRQIIYSQIGHDPWPATRAQGVAMDFLRTGVMPLASSDEQVTVIKFRRYQGPVLVRDSSSVEDVPASGLSLGNAALRLRFAPASYLATCIALAACCWM
ncbi:hypothetical protein B0H10DRAFT_2034233 [Mycena sp. CBHHK59/15]|nr:hypothetical protein B0H10DRAFT_2034233 [Mycena sp. CBHHK59/15]